MSSRSLANPHPTAPRRLNQMSRDRIAAVK
jgi:hypothetical protein